MARVLITGAAGFMGSHLMRKLVADGHYVVGFDDLSGAFKPDDGWGKPRTNRRVFDLRDRELTSDLVHDVKPELIYHLAANAREGASQFQPCEVLSRNFDAYMNVLEAAIATRSLRRVVLFSSMAVYGDQTPPFSEDMPTKPIDVYGVCKASMERVTQILAEVHGFEWTIIRPHNVYGPGQTLRDKFRNVAAIFMNRIMRGEPLTVYGDGEQRRAFSYIADSLPAYAMAGFEPRAVGQVINIGGKVDYSINDFLIYVHLAMRIADPRYQTMPEIVHLPDRPCEVKNAWSTWQKSADILGYHEEYTLQSGLNEMAKWAVEQGPQDWVDEELPLFNQSTPRHWLTTAQLDELNQEYNVVTKPSLARAN